MTIWKPQLPRQGKPLYLEIVEALEEDINQGVLTAGQRLPTLRELAREIGISLGTTTRAYEEAEKRGLVSSEVGRGTFVRSPGDQVPRYEIPSTPRSAVVDLSLNYPFGYSDEEEDRLLSDALRTIAGRGNLHQLTRYQPHVGLPHHRQAGADWIARTGLQTRASQVIVCNGMQHALSLGVAALTQPGDAVMCAEITYPGIKILAENRGLKLIPLEMDEKGIRPDAFQQAAAAGKSSLLYVIPTIQNPTTITMPEDRRQEIASIAVSHEVSVLEDDTYGMMPARPLQPISSWCGPFGYYCAGTTESIVPGLRIAYMRVVAEHVERISRAMLTTMWMVAPLMAELAAAWITDGTAEKLISVKRKQIARRQSLFSSILAEAAYRMDPGGFHLWLSLPEQWTALQYAHAALQRGVAITAADLFHVGTGRPPRAVRLCLGCTRDETRLRQGLAILGDLLHDSPQSGYSLT